MSTRSSLVEVDADKCVNCHVCISVCPVKFCNNGAGDHVNLEPDLCLGCGTCVHACPHEARRAVDDVGAWLSLLKNRQSFIAFIAPSAASSFPGQLRRLIGWLRRAGARAVVDVSFGAELAIWGYLKHLEKNQGTLICQPCPALVTYAEVHNPELLPYLAPVGSPLGHAVGYFAKHNSELTGLPMVFFSPCYAKKREIEEAGLSILNVTFASLDRLFKEHNVSLEAAEESEFDNPMVERGALFPTPGGLAKSLMRWRPELGKDIRTIEGKDLVYRYLNGLPDKISRGLAPLVIDCLNCEHGCNRGPGSAHPGEHPDALEPFVAERVKKLEGKNRRRWPSAVGRWLAGKWADFRMRRQLESAWSPDLARRSYRDLSRISRLRQPSQAELEELYHSMGKYADQDLFNCRACGYDGCEQMAVAIFNGLNRGENCHYFQRQESERKLLEQSRREVDEKERLHAEALREIEDRLRGATNRVIVTMGEQIQQMRQAYGGNVQRFQEMEKAVAEAGEALQFFLTISQTIQSVSFQTGLLSINAAIEASRAGRYGRSFAVVAEEVKRLSKMSDSEAEKIVPQMERISELFGNLTKSTQELAQRVNTHRKSFDHFEANLARMTSLWEEEKLHAVSVPEEK